MQHRGPEARMAVQILQVRHPEGRNYMQEPVLTVEPEQCRPIRLEQHGRLSDYKAEYIFK